MANNPGNSGLGPLIQLLMGGGGQGGGLGGLIQQLMMARQGWNGPGGVNQGAVGAPGPQPMGINGVPGPMPRPGNTAPMDNYGGKTGDRMRASDVAGSLTAPTGNPLPTSPNRGVAYGGPIPMMSNTGAPAGTGAGQQFANAGIYMGSPIVNALSGWNGPGGVNQGASGAPSLSGGGIPTYSGPPIPDLGPTLQQGQAMANVLGMQNSANPTLQNMAPLLMQQLLAPQRGPGWR